MDAFTFESNHKIIYTAHERMHTYEIFLFLLAKEEFELKRKIK